MTTYREIVGKKIKKVTSDPSDSIDGQMWYNSTTGAIRGLALNEGWSSAPNLGTGAYLAGSFGTQTAGVRICGTKYPGTLVSNVEHYNGTGWSEETNYPAAGQAISGAGTQTAGIAAGGSTPSQTANAFSYNGTSWTAANSLPYTANNMASCGLAQNNVIYAVGRDGSSGNSGTNKTITFDGTNFGNGPNINTTRMFNTVSGAGTGTAGLIIGGFIDPSPNNMTNCEEYDGTSWSNTDSLNVATGFASAWGTQTNAVTQNNSSNYSGSEAYNGSTWSALPNTGAPSPGGLYGITAGATGDAGWLSAINPSGTVYATTVEFNRSTNVVTGAAWASGGNLNTSRREIFTGTVGSQTSGLASGGATGPTGKSNATEEYNGSSWTTVNTVPVSLSSRGGAGTQTAGLLFGGNPNPTSVVTTTEYDGTNYSSGGDLNSARGYGPIAAGTQTAALAAGGHSGSSTVTTTEFYNGTAWTAQPNASPSVYTAASGGTQTAAWFAGGLPASTEGYNWDGTSWTASGNFTYGPSDNVFGGGPQTAGWLCGGNAPSVTTSTNHYDGTNFFTAPNMATARYGYGQAGDSSSSLIFGGAPGPGSAITNATEEFTGETETANVKTFSTS